MTHSVTYRHIFSIPLVHLSLKTLTPSLLSSIQTLVYLFLFPSLFLNLILFYWKSPTVVRSFCSSHFPKLHHVILKHTATWPFGWHCSRMDLGKELILPIEAKTIDLASCAEYVSWKLFENCSGQTMFYITCSLFFLGLYGKPHYMPCLLSVTEPNICGKCCSFPTMANFLGCAQRNHCAPKYIQCIPWKCLASEILWAATSWKHLSFFFEKGKLPRKPSNYLACREGKHALFSCCIGKPDHKDVKNNGWSK